MKPDKGHPAWLHKAMADGGSAWQGEGDSQRPKKEASAALTAKADRLARESRDRSHVGSAMVGMGGATALGAGSPGARRIIPRLIGAGVAALGTGMLKKANDLSDETDEARRGARSANDEAEGRKRGGKVKGKK